MSKKIRDNLFIAFIVVFVIMTILMSLYASGYKFNLSWPLKFNRILQKTGMLIIDTVPKNAKISLNGKMQKIHSLGVFNKGYVTTPTKLKNILPGEYTVRLELDGYWPFEKKIGIYSGQTTFAENINLFRSNLPLLIAATKDFEMSISPSYKYIYLAISKKIINLKTYQEKTIPLANFSSGVWEEKEDKIFSAGVLFDVEKETYTDYTKNIGENATKWCSSNIDKRLYYANGDSLNRLETDGKTYTTILNGEDYLCYEPRNEELFFISKENNKVFLKKYSIKTAEIKEKIELPAIGNYDFIPSQQERLTLYDKQNKTLYLINPSSFKDGITIIRNIISWQWKSSDELIYNNNWEIQLLDLKQNKSILISRVSEEIKQILWHSTNDYLIFSTISSFYAIDLKTGTITTVLQTELVNSPILDEKSDTLYFYAKTEQGEGIYKLLLQ